jgi:hypothetical protein
MEFALPMYARNELALYVFLSTRVSGALAPIDAASTVRAYIAASSAPEAQPINPSLSVLAEHEHADRWLVTFPAALLDVTVLDAAFGTTSPIQPPPKPFCMIDVAGGPFVFVPLVYVRERRATIGH